MLIRTHLVSHKANTCQFKHDPQVYQSELEKAVNCAIKDLEEKFNGRILDIKYDVSVINEITVLTALLIYGVDYDSQERGVHND